MDNVEEKIEKAIKASEKMISGATQNLYEAIRREKWGEAHELDAWIAGMNQTLLIFKNALGKKEPTA